MAHLTSSVGLDEYKLLSLPLALRLFGKGYFTSPMRHFAGPDEISARDRLRC